MTKNNADNLIGLQEAATILDMTPDEVRELIEAKHLTAFQLGDEVIRLKRSQVWEHQAKIRIKSELFPDDRERHHYAPMISKATVLDRLRDVVYFYDFYVISIIIIASLTYLIMSSGR